MKPAPAAPEASSASQRFHKRLKSAQMPRNVQRCKEPPRPRERPVLFSEQPSTHSRFFGRSAGLLLRLFCQPTTQQHCRSLCRWLGGAGLPSSPVHHVHLMQKMKTATIVRNAFCFVMEWNANKAKQCAWPPPSRLWCRPPPLSVPCLPSSCLRPPQPAHHALRVALSASHCAARVQ